MKLDYLNIIASGLFILGLIWSTLLSPSAKWLRKLDFIIHEMLPHNGSSMFDRVKGLEKLTTDQNVVLQRIESKVDTAVVARVSEIVELKKTNVEFEKQLIEIQRIVTELATDVNRKKVK